MRRWSVVLVVFALVACERSADTAAPAPRPSLSTSPPSSSSPHASPSHKPKPSPRPSPSQTASPVRPSSLPSSLIGTEWVTLPTTQHVVALTFDAGANDAGVASILATLRSEGIPATFFLTGRWTELYPDEARQIGRSYPVGNHTETHPYLTTLSDQQVRNEIESAGEEIRSATGRDDRPMFRFPYGDSDARTIGIANDLGYGGIRWTVDTLGWKGTSGGETADRIVGRVLDGLRPGAIVLMHVGSNPDDGTTLDADSLPRMIEEIRARGYSFVMVPDYL
jgi:peptidoglycan/xylan/chitin deacetylase (PgdA/CDA1 family)